MPTSKHQRKLSNYLLNKDLQLRYVAFVTALSAAISGILGFLIWRQGAKASNSIRELLASSGFDAEHQETISSSLTTTDTNLVLIMAVFGVGLVIVLSLYLVVFTHKVAGPLYKVSLYFDKMAQGRLDTVYRLRKGDLLQDFYSLFRECHKTVKARHGRDNRAVSNFLEACDRVDTPKDEEFSKALEDLRTHKRLRDEALA